MKTVLMVAEKPSLANSIAKILSHGSMNTRKGPSNACSVHEYKGNFLIHVVANECLVLLALGQSQI